MYLLTTNERSPRFIFIAIIALLSILTPFAISISLPGIPLIAENLHIPISSAQQTVVTYLFGFSLAHLIAGPLVDSFGRRKIMLISLLVFSVSSILINLVSNITNLLILRVIEALGAAGVADLINVLIYDLIVVY